MKNAVIYARFSSHGQNEQTIDGQIRFCREFAERMGLNVIDVYEEKARSGTTDHRPAFQEMIKAATQEKFQYIIVYMLDRFARNRRDSVFYKEMLKQEHGIKVLSATQQISDDEGGEFYEMFLEWNDEKYSKRLSKRVIMGFDTAVKNGTYTGCKLIYGYRLIDTERTGKKGTIHKVAVDDEQAKIVRFVFNEYAKGVDKKTIANQLNTKGMRLNGKPFLGRSFDRWLTNRKYTGSYYLGTRLCENTFPAIIDQLTFDKVQQRLARNRYLAGANSAIEPYLLTGKAFCGYCGKPMTAGGGKSKTGKKHYYYVCHGKVRNACHKSRENKDNLEKIVISIVQDFLSDKANIERAVTDTIAYYEQRTGTDGLKSIETQIAKTTAAVENMTNAFIQAQNSLLRQNIENKMREYEILLQDLQRQQEQILAERGKQITRADIYKFIAELIKGNPNDKVYQKLLIDNIVDRVYVYDDCVIPYLTIGNDKSIQRARLAETDQIIKALQDQFRVQSQLLIPDQNTRTIKCRFMYKILRCDFCEKIL